MLTLAAVAAGREVIVSRGQLIEIGGSYRLPDVMSASGAILREVGTTNKTRKADYESAVGENTAALMRVHTSTFVGGPQCGIIVGRRELVDRITKHPMMRALRVDKLTLAALAATLRLYRDEESAQHAVPLLSLLGTPLENLRNRAERLAPQMAACDAIAAAEPLEAEAFLGGGSVPTQRIATWCIALGPRSGNVDQLAKALRSGVPAVVGRVQQQKLLLDLRSVDPANDLRLVEAVRQLHLRNATAPRPKPLGDFPQVC
jgi:L-seryl-tRNA(Ser) seleniumtransferase